MIFLTGFDWPGRKGRELKSVLERILTPMLKQNQNFLDQFVVVIYRSEPDTLIFQRKETQILQSSTWMLNKTDRTNHSPLAEFSY